MNSNLTLSREPLSESQRAWSIVGGFNWMSRCYQQAVIHATHGSCASVAGSGSNYATLTRFLAIDVLKYRFYRRYMVNCKLDFKRPFIRCDQVLLLKWKLSQPRVAPQCLKSFIFLWVDVAAMTSRAQSGRTGEPPPVRWEALSARLTCSGVAKNCSNSKMEAQKKGGWRRMLLSGAEWKAADKATANKSRAAQKGKQHPTTKRFILLIL